MRYADMALYRAKNEGRNRACIYDAAMDADLSQAQAARRRSARGDRATTACGSPISRSSTPAARPWSASKRWPLEPSRRAATSRRREFIPIAEHSGLIIELGEWVLRRACTRRQGLAGRHRRRSTSRRCNSAAPISSTSSNASCARPSSTPPGSSSNSPKARCSAMSTPPKSRMHAAQGDRACGSRSTISAPAIRASLYLRRFPFDKLKIDRSFVRSIERPPDAAAIVHAMVEPRPRPRHEGDRRRRRDRRAAVVPARGRRAFDAGLSLRHGRGSPSQIIDAARDAGRLRSIDRGCRGAGGLSSPFHAQADSRADARPCIRRMRAARAVTNASGTGDPMMRRRRLRW